METTSLSKNPEQDQKVITINPNWPQMEVELVRANETWCLWGRGTGKTTGPIASFVIRVAEAMPGHLSCLAGLNFTHLETNVIPKIKIGLREKGYEEDKHFIVGKRPPKGWKSCLYPIDIYDRTITWHNGTTFQEISCEQKGSANAFDFQSGVFDEVKFLDKQTVESEIIPAFRGEKDKFGHLPEYLSKIFATDKYADYIKIKWILDKRKLVDKKAVQLIIQTELKVIELETAYVTATKQEQKRIAAGIAQIEARLNLLRKSLVHVSEASALDNFENLGQAWLDDQKKKGAYQLAVAVYNEDPTQSGNTYYPGLKDKHEYLDLYEGCDYNANLPFLITSDYQHSIAPICVAQLSTLPWEQQPTLNTINEFYAMHPEGHEETIAAFSKYYSTHINKTVVYVYDHTAIGERASAEPIKDTVVKSFIAKGWVVIEVYTAHPPEHFIKYVRLKAMMDEGDDIADVTPVRFNKAKCIKTLISMRGAGTVATSGKTHKDKRFENTKTYPDLDQSETTHFSDTWDQLAWAVNELHLVQSLLAVDPHGIALR